MPGRSTKEKGREEEEPDKGREERTIRSEIAQEVVAGIKEEASAREDAKSTSQKTVGQRFKQNWECSQIENEEEEEEKGWLEEDQMAVQKDGRKFFAAGSYAKGTRISGTGKLVQEIRREGHKRKE